MAARVTGVWLGGWYRCCLMKMTFQASDGVPSAPPPHTRRSKCRTLSSKPKIQSFPEAASPLAPGILAWFFVVVVGTCVKSPWNGGMAKTGQVHLEGTSYCGQPPGIWARLKDTQIQEECPSTSRYSRKGVCCPKNCGQGTMLTVWSLKVFWVRLWVLVPTQPCAWPMGSITNNICTCKHTLNSKQEATCRMLATKIMVRTEVTGYVFLSRYTLQWGGNKETLKLCKKNEGPR